MSSSAVITVVKMIESLPESIQGQVVERLREHLEDIRDELRWDEAFEKTQNQLAAAARRAKQEIASGLAEPLDTGRL